MGKPKPWWKGEFLNRSWLRNEIEETFQRCATDDFDEAVAHLINELELYIVMKVVKHSKDAMMMIRKDLDSAMETLSDMERAVLREQVKRKGKTMESDEDE
jgi:transcription termination factor NusB